MNKRARRRHFAKQLEGMINTRKFKAAIAWSDTLVAGFGFEELEKVVKMVNKNTQW